jgi:hypothetical protein
MFHDLDRIEGKVFWIEIFDRMTGFSGLTGEAERVFLTELTEFTELGFLVFTLCFLLNIDRAVFWQRGGLFVWFVCIS